MSDPSTNTSPGLAPQNQGVPEVLALSPEKREKLLRDVEATMGDQLAGIVERNLEQRGDLQDAQADRKRAALTAALTYSEANKEIPVMGAFFQQCMKEGQESRSLTHRVERISEQFEKAVGSEVAKTLNIATADEGGIFVEGTVLEQWLEPLRAASVVLSLNPEVQPVVGDMLGVNGFETDPTLFWVGEENTDAISSTPTTGAREAAMRKAMALIPVTRDFREGASPQIFRRIEDLMRNAFRVGLDLRYITGSGIQNTVKGLRNHITATSATAGQTLAQVFTDAETALLAIESTNIMAERIGILMHPRSKYHLMFIADADGHPVFLDEIRAGTWLGLPFRTTTNIPINLGGGNESYIIWQAFNQFFIGQGTGLDLQWYQNASYTEAGSLVSTIERDTEVLVGRQKTATLMPRTTSGYVTTAVVWGT